MSDPLDSPTVAADLGDPEAESSASKGKADGGDAVSELLLKQWEVVVGVQKHFNDLEWRIRGVALTALTAIIGFSLSSSVSGRSYHLGCLSIGLTAIVGALGALVWSAFHVTDAKWYHPMLGGAGLAANELENKLAEGLKMDPEKLLSHTIYNESKKSVILRKSEWHSRQKLNFFYGIGYVAIGILVIGSLVSWNAPSVRPAAATPSDPSVSATPAGSIPPSVPSKKGS